MKRFVILSAFILALISSTTTAKASSVTVVVRKASDQSQTLDISRLERSVVRILALQENQKVLNRTKAMKDCASPECFRSRLNSSTTATWFLIEYEVVRKGIFGLGSRCVVTIEQRDQNGLRIGEPGQNSSSCSIKRLVESTENILRDFVGQTREVSKNRSSEMKNLERSVKRPNMDKKFTACGKTRKEAMELLSQTISSRISDSFTSKETAKNEDEKIEISKEVSIQSNVHLSNVEWSEKDDEVCVSQGYEELLSATLARLERVSECEQQMPEQPKLKERVVSACLSDIRFVSEIYPIFWGDMSESYRQIAKSLEMQAARLEDLGGKIFFQSIRVDAKASDGKLFIDKVEQPMSTPLFVPPGEVLIEIKSDKRCDFSKKITVQDRKQVVLQPELSKVDFPQVTFEVGQKGANLTVDGRLNAANRVLVFSRCSGKIPYKLMLRDGESETGQVELEPGLKDVIQLRVLTLKERKQLSVLATSFDRSGLLTGKYILAYPFSEKLDDNSVINQFDVTYTVGRGAFRYGGGASYGFSGTSTHLFEAYGVLAAQLTNFGKNPLHIAGTLAVIPYLSVDLGFGLHAFETNVSERRSDFGSFVNSYVIARGHAGARIAFNEELSFEFDFSHNLTMERALGLNLGVSVRLP